MISRRPNTRARGRVAARVIPSSGGSPPAVPILTAPAADGSQNVFNGVAATVSATADGTTTQVQWILDPSGAATVVATDNAAPFTQSWTPTGVSLGSHTLIARASNAFGSTDSASLSITVGEVIHTLVTSKTTLRAWQADFGLALGGTPLASGTGPPPAITLTGAITSTFVYPALRIEIQTTGADGTATYRYGNANTGSASVWIESNKVVPAGGGTYNAIGALAGLVLNFPAGTYTNDNVYQGTCAGWVDQKNTTTASQAVAGKQPLILVDAAGRLFLRFDGTDDTLVEAALDLPAPATTPTYVESAFTLRSWTANKTLFAATAGNMQLVTQTATPQLKMFNASFSAGTGPTIGTLSRGETLFTGSVSDRLKIAATSVTGTSAGNNNAAAGINLGSSVAANFGPYDVYDLIFFNGEPSAGEKTSLDTTMVAMYTNPAIAV